MTLAVAEALSPNKPNIFIQEPFYGKEHIPTYRPHVVKAVSYLNDNITD